MRRVIRWTIVMLAFAAAARAVWRPAIEWTERYWQPNLPKFPQSTLDRAFLDGWRRVDHEAPRPMASTAFTVRMDESDAGRSVESLTIENASSQVIRNVWFFRDDMPNFYDARTLVDSTTKGLTTDTEKVMALWGLFPKYYYNWYPLSASGLLFDPPTQLAVLGTAQCNYAVSVLETLCQMAGCETRPLGVQYESARASIAHCVMEAKADGRWIYLDPDGHAVYRRPDGLWASAEDLKQCPDLVLTAPHAYYDSLALADAFAHGSVEYVDTLERLPFSLAQRQTDVSHFSLFHHVMRFDLLPGARTILWPRRHGRFYSMELPEYGTGVLTWACHARWFVKGACKGLLMDNVAAEIENGTLVLRPAVRGRTASLVIPQTSPYLMTGGELWAEFESREDVDVFVLPFYPAPVMPDDGWQKAASVRGHTALKYDGLFKPMPLFGYALKLRVPPSGVTVHALRLMTWLQCAPRALPHLEAGANAFTLYSEAASIAAIPDGDELAAGFDNGLRIRFTLSAQTHPKAL